MLMPAVLKKEEIKKAFQSFYYTDDMLYETGGMRSWFPDISEQTNDGGNKCVLHDAIKDRRGVYHDDVIYEIVRKS